MRPKGVIPEIPPSGEGKLVSFGIATPDPFALHQDLLDLGVFQLLSHSGLKNLSSEGGEILAQLSQEI